MDKSNGTDLGEARIIREFGTNDIGLISKAEMVRLIGRQQKFLSSIIEDLYMADRHHPIFEKLSKEQLEPFKAMRRHRKKQRIVAMWEYFCLFPKTVWVLSKKMISNHKKGSL
jgi:hypothetical protein